MVIEVVTSSILCAKDDLICGFLSLFLSSLAMFLCIYIYFQEKIFYVSLIKMYSKCKQTVLTGKNNNNTFFLLQPLILITFDILPFSCNMSGLSITCLLLTIRGYQQQLRMCFLYLISGFLKPCGDKQTLYLRCQIYH